MILAVLFLVNRVAGEVHAQTIQGAGVHAGQQHGGVHVAALEVGQLVQGSRCQLVGGGAAGQCVCSKEENGI